MENLEKFAGTIESGFVGRCDKPQLVQDQFQNFWSATYGTWTTPTEEWPESIQRCLGIDVESVPSTVPSAPSSPLPPSSPILPIYELSQDCTPDVVDTPETPTTPRISPACYSNSLHSRRITSTERRFLGFPPTVSPSSPLRTKIPAAPTTPKRIGKRTRNVSNSVASSAMPKSKRRRIEAGDDKENVSPSARILGEIPSISERIAMKTQLAAMVTSPANRKTSGVVKRQLATEDDEKDEELVERPSPLKRGKMSGEMESRRRALSPSQGSDDTMEERNIALSLLQPSPCPPPPQKRWFMESVEVPSFEEVLFKRRLRRSASLGNFSESLGMKTPSISRERVILTTRPSKKTAKIVPDPFLSSPMSTLRLSNMNTAKLVRTVSAPAAVPPSSSDDDPRYGQVTPHHLISPALKKGACLFDPPSDDSLPPSSPTNAVASRRLAQRRNPVGSVV